MHGDDDHGDVVGSALGEDEAAWIACFEQYLCEEGYRVARAAFEENLQQKLSDPEFRADMTPLLRPGIDWDVDRAGEAVMRHLLSRLSG